MSHLPPVRRRTVTVALAGLAAVGVVLTASACSNSSTPQSGAAPATASAPPAAAGKHHRPKGIAGKITAQNGTNWTVVNAKGRQFTVTITPTTAFGTKKAPATEQQFTVGSTIRVMGDVQNGTVTATRITDAKQPDAPAGTAAPTSAAAPAPGNG